MAAESFGEALRRLRRERGYSSIRQFAEAVNYSIPYLSEIERGAKQANQRVATACDRVLGTGHFLTALVEAEAPVAPDDASTTLESDFVTLREVAMAAAHESTSRAAAEGSVSVSPTSIEQVRSDVELVAARYGEIPPVDLLLEARRVRDLAIKLADRTRRPSQTSDLYITAGQACALMAVASFDLNVWQAATEQARAAYLYGEIVNSDSLQAWARGFQALTAYWSGRPEEATRLADAGLELAPSGTPSIRLYNIAARAWSHLGDTERTRAALASAERERDSIGANGTDDLHDRIGGQFGWGPARQAMCSASALLRIGDVDHAIAQARLAIELRQKDRTGALVDAKAAADLAAAEVERGNLDAAEAALAIAWDVEPSHRRHPLVSRLAGIAERLTDDRYRRVSEARDIRDQIEAYTSDSAPRTLPPGLAQ